MIEEKEKQKLKNFIVNQLSKLRESIINYQLKEKGGISALTEKPLQ